ncbi:MAG: endonuclease [Paludibacteraceae bacterium]|nr:endonuclease [Paludibacteraceae bacterium]
MRKYIVVILALVAQMGWANVVTGVAAIPDGYYDGVDGKKGADNILNALQTCISRDYDEISYSSLEEHYLKTDFYADTLWDMYSTCRFVFEDANKQQKAVCDGWNKEHVCCQSWIGGRPMESDMFNVYPTDARINNLRSNYPYGVVGTNNGFSKDPDKHGLGKLGTSTTSGVGTVYEPDDKYKGDFARTFFYMVARYRDKTLNSGDGSAMFTSSPTDLTSYSLSFLLNWHRNDPVSEKEVDRNQGVYGEQNNRNPFIDYPELVEYIWGNKKGEQVDLSTMTPTCESITPTPQTTVKYGVTWMVNGVELYTDSVVEGKKPSKLPDDPESCSETSESFYGWAGGSWDGALPDYLPMDIDEFSNIDYMPAIVFDVTYHAVFAHKEVTSTGIVQRSETITFKDQGYSNGAAVTELKQGDVTITFGKGTAGSNVPKYYNTGEAVRCYPGNTMTVEAENMTAIELTFGSGDSNNTISVSPGTFNGSKWTGNANKVVFSIGGSSNHRRIAAVKTTLNGSGEQTEYTYYLTKCEDTTDIANPAVNAPVARKMLRDGQLIIVVDKKEYNILGF